MNKDIHKILKRCFMTTVMVVCAVGAWADGVAKIGDTEYATLKEAVDAASADATIQLISNTSAQETIEITKNITLDLNGFTFTSTLSGKSGSNPALSVEGCSLTLEDNSEGKAGNIVSDEYGISIINGGTTIVNSGTITSGFAVITGNNLQGDMNISVNGGTLTSTKSEAIYMPSQGTLSVTGGTINGGISARMGQISISGGTINGMTSSQTADSFGEYWNYNGSAWIGDAIYVWGGTYGSDNATYGNSCSVNITGGTINGNNHRAICIYDIANNNNQTIDITINGTAAVNGEVTIDDTKKQSTNNVTPKYEISGGTFSEPVNPDYCADGFEPVVGADGKYTAVATGSAVAQIGDTKYATLAAAISAAGTTETTITFLADVSDDITISTDAKITLNVGDYTYSGTITNSGTCVLSGGTYTNLPPANCCVSNLPIKNSDENYNLTNSWEISDATTTLPEYLNTGYYSVATAKYTRNSGMVGAGSTTGTKYGTICLPFSIKEQPTDMTLYKATNISGSTLTITSVGYPIAAGTPLIFELTNAATTMSITSSNATVNTTAPSTSTTEGNILIGTFAATTITSDLANIYYLNGDKFHQAQTSLVVPIYRAYLKTQSSSGAKPRMISIVKDDETTAISDIQGVDTVTEVYDLNGRKQNGLQRGVNIMRRADGSTIKVLVK